MVGEGIVFQGMRGYTVPPHAPVVACFTMSATQHIWLKKKYYRVPTFSPVVSEATRLSIVPYSWYYKQLQCFVIHLPRPALDWNSELLKAASHSRSARESGKATRAKR